VLIELFSLGVTAYEVEP